MLCQTVTKRGGEDLHCHTIASQLAPGHNHSTEGKGGGRGTPDIKEGCRDVEEGSRRAELGKTRRD